MKSAVAMGWRSWLWGLMLSVLAGSLHAQQASAPIPYKQAHVAEAPSPQQWLAVVLVCAVALVVLMMVLRRHGGILRVNRPAADRVKVLERTSLGPQQGQLVVIEYGGRRMLIATGQTYTTCLRDDAIEEPKA
jgi:flagellar biogenesis protein FliO